ncbi:hypothetical protein [Corynebacterium freneyi]|nr:hypothetical protein [Corynebacterium freneyi]
MEQRKPSASMGTSQIIGLATVVAIVLGVGVWAIAEFAMGKPRSDAIGSGASAAGPVLVIAVIYAVYLALRSGDER